MESFDSFHFDKRGERYGKSSFATLGKTPNKESFELKSISAIFKKEKMEKF